MLAAATPTLCARRLTLTLASGMLLFVAPLRFETVRLHVAAGPGVLALSGAGTSPVLTMHGASDAAVFDAPLRSAM